jgi:hypothetical protein
MIVRFRAITDGDESIDVRVMCTQLEWEALIAPAVLNKWPIDGATVDSDMLDKLMSRPPAKGRAKHVVLLV